MASVVCDAVQLVYCTCALLQTFPFFGIVAEILSEDGTLVEGEGEGYLVNNRPVHLLAFFV